MPWSVTLNGTTYTDEDFAGLNYVTSFFDLLSDLAAHVAGAWVGTSGTSLAIGTGTKTLVIVGSGFVAGQPIRLADAAAPTTNLMDGELTAYNAATGTATVEVSSVRGSGTKTAWVVMVGHVLSTTVSTPVAIADGGTAATTARQAVENLEISLTRYAQEYADEPNFSVPFGDAWYLVSPTGTGDFLGEDGKWAFTDDGGSTWAFTTPSEGDVAVVQFDFVTTTPSGDEANNSAWVYDGADWVPLVLGTVAPLEFSGNTTILGTGAVLAPVTAIKTGTGTPTLTLPATWSQSPLRPVIVINRGASGTLTVNVASGGTISGSGTATVLAGAAKQFIYSGTSGVWYAFS